MVVFDGVCNLCSHTVEFIVRHEVSPSLRFASVQSPAGARIMRECGLDPEDARTFVLVEGEQVYFRSEAAIRVSRYLRQPWRSLALLRLVPRVARDWLYDVVARNRYRWFGRRDVCVVPSAAMASRFLGE